MANRLSGHDKYRRLVSTHHAQTAVIFTASWPKWLLLTLDVARGAIMLESNASPFQDFDSHATLPVYPPAKSPGPRQVALFAVSDSLCGGEAIFGWDLGCRHQQLRRISQVLIVVGLGSKAAKQPLPQAHTLVVCIPGRYPNLDLISLPNRILERSTPGANRCSRRGLHVDYVKILRAKLNPTERGPNVLPFWWKYFRFGRLPML